MEFTCIDPLGKSLTFEGTIVDTSVSFALNSLATVNIKVEFKKWGLSTNSPTRILPIGDAGYLRIGGTKDINIYFDNGGEHGILTISTHYIGQYDTLEEASAAEMEDRMTNPNGRTKFVVCK